MRLVVVRGLSRASTQGKLDLGFVHFPCAVGRAGRGHKAREGDGVTPSGRWSVRHVYYRPDLERRPRTRLPVSPLAQDLGWCDAPADPNYNRLVRSPYPGSHERLWRADRLYDFIVILGFNDRPRARGRGSAIFIHCARPGYAPTEGCVALARDHLLRLLEALGPDDEIVIS